MPRLTSPLQYVGGKARAAQMIFTRFPLFTGAIASPFLGGGGLELALAARGVRVRAYDGHAPLVNFWNAALTDPRQLSQECAAIIGDAWEQDADGKYIVPFTSADFQALKARTDAAGFYAYNRLAFNGGATGAVRRRSNSDEPKLARRLEHFRAPGLSVELADFRQSIPSELGAFIYADPPYIGREAYYAASADGFDHAALADALGKHSGGFALSYNDHPRVRDLYSGCEIIDLEWKYTCASGGVGRGDAALGKELLVLG